LVRKKPLVGNMSAFSTETYLLPANEIEIHDLTHDGRGVGHHDGKACFVEGALPGERVSWVLTKSQRQFDEGRLESVLQSSPDRVQPSCEYFGICGGCQLQHLSYSAQVQAKQARLESALKHKGIQPEIWLQPLLSNPLTYRRRARLSISRTSKKSPEQIVGFKHRASAQIVSIDQCAVLIPELNLLIPHIPALVDRISNQQGNSICELELSFDGECTSLILIADQAGPSTSLQDPPEAMQHCDIWYRPKKGNATLIYTPDPTKKKSTPPGFMQANAEINKGISEKIEQLLNLQKSDHLLDLFCGAGNFSFVMASQAGQVTGIDIQGQAVDSARSQAQGSEHLTFLAADLFDSDALKNLRAIFRKASAVILDPPRSGAEAVVAELCKPKPNRILYVSCHPATFVRDAEMLVSKGYRLQSLGLVDMFPQSMHTEVLGLFIL